VLSGSRSLRFPPIVRYQLVLQFEGDTFDDFEQIVALEAALVERLGDLILLDSHDVGSDECKILVLTADPVGAFSGMSPVLERMGLLDAVVATYHPVGGKGHTVIWPENSASSSSIT
jgi:hypothetical protein